MSVARGVCYEFPLRGGDFVCQLVLPYDLRADEVERLTAMLRTLPQPPREDEAGERGKS